MENLWIIQPIIFIVSAMSLYSCPTNFTSNFIPVFSRFEEPLVTFSKEVSMEILKTLNVIRAVAIVGMFFTVYSFLGTYLGPVIKKISKTLYRFRCFIEPIAYFLSFVFLVDSKRGNVNEFMLAFAGCVGYISVLTYSILEHAKKRWHIEELFVISVLTMVVNDTNSQIIATMNLICIWSFCNQMIREIDIYLRNKAVEKTKDYREYSNANNILGFNTGDSTDRSIMILQMMLIVACVLTEYRYGVNVLATKTVMKYMNPYYNTIFTSVVTMYYLLLIVASNSYTYGRKVYDITMIMFISVVMIGRYLFVAPNILVSITIIAGMIYSISRVITSGKNIGANLFVLFVMMYAASNYRFIFV